MFPLQKTKCQILLLSQHRMGDTNRPVKKLAC